MIDVGRRKWAWPDLPPRMKGRRLASGKCLYYYQAAGKQIPLGSNIIAAKEKWAQLEAGGVGALRFPQVTAIYRKAVFPGLALGTRSHYALALDNLDLYLKAFRLDQVEPKHVKAYMRKRSSKGAAVFEKKVGSAFFNWARAEGHTNCPNPFHGMKFSKAEKRAYNIGGKRDRYVTDAEFDAVHARGDAILQDAMDLALLTGQRPGDILKARRQDIVDGVLWFVQEKTGAKVGVRVEAALQRVVARILARERPVPSMYLICDRRGQRLRYGPLHERFLKALGDADWQFRDIRAKAATDSPDLKRAQQLLGHVTEATTASVYRRSSSNVVAPLERKIKDVS